MKHQAVELLLHLGAVHASTGIATLVWLFYVLYEIRDSGGELLGLIGTIIALSIGIIFVAIPRIRHLSHDFFEWTHRFGGWTTLGLLWITVFVYYGKHVSKMISEPDIYIAIITTSVIFYPWLSTRKVKVRCEFPSKHVAFLYFDGFVDFGR
jgi:hypothetical protein